MKSSLVKSLREEVEGHQKFAEAICWRLAMHTFRGMDRNNGLVPPSLQADFFSTLRHTHAGSLNALQQACFDSMQESEFDDYWYGRKLMDLTKWKGHVLRLGREAHLSEEKVAEFQDAIKYLDLAHVALVACRSALNSRTWFELVEAKSSMLFTWLDPRKKFTRQRLSQRQTHPWRESEDYLDRNPHVDVFLPTYWMTPMKWWPDRSAPVWRIAITEYPLRLDRKQPKGPKQWAVRLTMDPYYEVVQKMKQEPRYIEYQSWWHGTTEEEDLAEVRKRYSMFRSP